MRSKPNVSSERIRRRSFKEAWRCLQDLPFPTGGPDTPTYMNLLAELADLDAFMFTWLNRVNDHAESEIAAELTRVSEFESRVRSTMVGHGEPAEWQHLLQYVLAMRATLVAALIPASGV